MLGVTLNFASKLPLVAAVLAVWVVANIAVVSSAKAHAIHPAASGTAASACVADLSAKTSAPGIPVAVCIERQSAAAMQMFDRTASTFSSNENNCSFGHVLGSACCSGATCHGGGIVLSELSSLRLPAIRGNAQIIHDLPIHPDVASGLKRPPRA